MTYVSKKQIVAAREMDLLTYLRKFEPQELVHKVPSRVMRKLVCRLWLNEVNRQ